MNIFFELLAQCAPVQYSPGQHYVKQNSKAPDITCGIITLPLEYFWGYKVGGVARRGEEPVIRSQLFGESEINDAQR